MEKIAASAQAPGHVTLWTNESREPAPPRGCDKQQIGRAKYRFGSTLFEKGQSGRRTTAVGHLWTRASAIGQIGRRAPAVDWPGRRASPVIQS